MFKQIFTLMRGRRYEAMEAVTDRHALPILRQQIREGAQAVEASRRAVAVAIAQNEQERAQHARLDKQILDLEQRTVAALEQGRDELAREAAESIAHLEAERDASAAAQARFGSEIARLRACLRDAEARLRNLQRGQRLAVATDRTQRLQVVVPDSGLASLRDAEETLKRLQDRQNELDATAAAMRSLEAEGSAEGVREKLAAAGCGAPLTTTADEVLERLASRLTPKKAASK